MKTPIIAQSTTLTSMQSASSVQQSMGNGLK